MYSVSYVTMFSVCERNYILYIEYLIYTSDAYRAPGLTGNKSSFTLKNLYQSLKARRNWYNVGRRNRWVGEEDTQIHMPKISG